MFTHYFSTGYEILQDVHGLGEHFGITEPSFNSDDLRHCLSGFEPLPRLTHLQRVFDDQPYFGRRLRYFNHAPWWYRLRFDVPADAPSGALLRIGPVDYFADVWLNGRKLGCHEGYFAPFNFEVGDALERGKQNTLLIRVSAPWDEQMTDGPSGTRIWDVERNQIKGTYEHADTFVQRDVNPIGMLKPASIEYYDAACIRNLHAVASIIDSNGRVDIDVDLAGQLGGGAVCATLLDGEGRAVASATGAEKLTLEVPNVRRWHCVGHGAPNLYTLRVELMQNEQVQQTLSRTLGFRTVELRRTEERTEYYLNGRRIFVRGTTYFADVYMSAMTLARYRRDLTLAVQAGMNLLRVHVHVEQPEFYQLCDELGLMVIQDSDINWLHPRTDAFCARACSVFGDMLRQIGHHPSIVTWICHNEPDRTQDDYFMNVLGPKLERIAQQLTPGIPTIRGSYCNKELHSGDSHNYLGSLNGENTHYTDTVNIVEKFNTEFGVDAPPCQENLWIVPALANRLDLTDAEIESIQHYQYRLIKYYIELYRIQKYNVMAGYVQFMFIDFCPQSFYGVLDYWCMPKPGYEALMESNQPLLVCLEHDTECRALWAINDTYEDIDATLRYTAVDGAGRVTDEGVVSLRLPADSSVRVCDYVRPLTGETLTLLLLDAVGHVLNRNRYTNPLSHPIHPQGHPNRIDAEIGMRLFNSKSQR